MKIFMQAVSVIAALTLSNSAIADDGYHLHENDLNALNVEVVVPNIWNRSLLTDASGGTIVYDAQSGAFYGLPPSVSPGTGSNWIQLGGSTTGSSIISSSAGYRIESAYVQNNGTCSFSSNTSSAWTVSNTATGECTIAFNAASYTSDPVCVISGTTANAFWAGKFRNLSTTGIIITTTNTGGAAQNNDSTIICMGH